MDQIRLGMIGVGQIGKKHIGKYNEIEGAKIVAVADLDEAEAQRVATENSIPNVYTDFRRLLARDDIDAVDVCLHNNYHMPVSVEALRAGKHVYCEKPMAGSYSDAQEMYEVARTVGRKLSIQLVSLFSTETRVARTLIELGRLGRLYHARSTGFRRRGRPYVDGYGSATFVQKQHSGGGALYDMGVYHIANMIYLLGNPEVARVSGKIYQETEVDPGRQASSGYDVEELGLGFVKFQGGLTLDIIESWAVHLNAFEGSSIVGSEGGIRLNPFGFFHNIGDLEVDSAVNLQATNYRWHALRENADAYDSPQQHWIAALQGRVELMPTAEIALNTMLIQEGIYLSDKLGREVGAEEIVELSESTAVPV